MASPTRPGGSDHTSEIGASSFAAAPATNRPLIHIGGNVSGQVAYGQFVYQIQAPGGTVTQIAVEDPIRPRPRPVDVRPAPRSPPLGRGREIALLESGGDRVVQIHAGEGWGKSTLLRHLARHAALESARDGVAYLTGWGRPIEDVEQDLFEAFFETALPQMRLQATPGQIRAAMADVEAALLVDDLDLERHHVERLVDDAPRCRVVVTSSSLTLFDGLDVALGGLDAVSSVQLLADRLGRLLDVDEEQAVRAYAAACDGQPLALVLAAAALRRGAVAFEDLGGGVDAVADALDGSLAPAERRALGVLEAVGGAPLPAEAVGAAVTIDQPHRVLEVLHADGIVQTASPRFRLPKDVAAHLDLGDHRAETLTGLAVWAGEVSDPELLVSAGTALIGIAQWGQNHAPQATVELARAAHAGLSLGGAWETWGELLTAADEAAAVPFDQAWALHEMGTRDFLLGDRASAAARLHRALDIRSRIGDQDGARVTRHNLDLLEGPPPGGDRGGDGPDGPYPGRWLAGVALVLALVLTGALYATGVIRSETTSPTTSPTTPPTVPLTTAPTISPTTTTPDPSTSDQITSPSVSTQESTSPTTLIEGRLETDTDPLDMGETIVGNEVERRWVVVNRGPGPVDISGVSIDPPFGVNGNCETLDVQESCGMIVVFAPAEPGPYQETLTVEYDGAESPLIALVVGSAVPVPVGLVAASPDTVDFETVVVGNAKEIPVEIRNEGDAPVSNVTPSLRASSAFTLDNHCSSLEPGASCLIEVSLTPGGVGPYSGTLVIAHSGDNEPVEIQMRGNGVVG